MKYRASMLMFGIGVAVGVVASAVAETGIESERGSTLFSEDPKECETVVSNLLQRKKEALDRRERTINVRETDIKTAEKRIEQKIEERSALRDELRELMQDMDAKQLEEIDRLVKIVEKMRGKQAAGIIESIEDDNISIAVLRRMGESKAGKTMSSMNKEHAAKLFTLIAQHPKDK